MSLKSSMNISDLTLEDVKKEMALDGTFPVSILFKADMAGADTGALQFMKKIDLMLAEAEYTPVIKGANCLFQQSGPLSMAAAGGASYRGQLQIWDDEPVDNGSFYEDDGHTSMTDEFAYADEDSDRELISWPIHNFEKVIAGPLVDAHDTIQPDGKPTFIPEYQLKDGACHVVCSLIKNVATTGTWTVWGSIILWVKWMKKSQAEFNSMVMGELSNR